MALTIKLINNEREFYQLKNEWEKFESEVSHHNITSSYMWLSTWWEVFSSFENNSTGYDKEILILLLYDNENLIAIAPFVKLKRKKYGFKITFVEFLSQQISSTLIDIIGKDLSQKHIQLFFDWIDKNVKYDVLLLRYIPESSNSFDRSKLIKFSVCPKINLSDYESYEEFQKENYSKNLKQNLRTSLNKMKRENENVNVESEKINENFFDEISEISKSKLSDDKEWLYGHKYFSAFYRAVYTRMESNVVFVKIGDKRIAYRANIIFNNSKYCIDASYDREYRKYDPGIFSVDINIKDSFSKSYTYHFLGPGEDQYKLKFTKDINYIYQYIKKGNKVYSYFSFIIILYLIKMKERKLIKSQNYLQKKH